MTRTLGLGRMQSRLDLIPLTGYQANSLHNQVYSQMGILNLQPPSCRNFEPLMLFPLFLWKAGVEFD